ncbi:hypothetical protein OG203_25800 [Nocardia sp. NBC_01499]|uniref:hypothetical protein n=1 Tax=Nocardia sp. NBC_01499 TaxID=2903597 RepID=UPI00386FFECA
MDADDRAKSTEPWHPADIWRGWINGSLIADLLQDIADNAAATDDAAVHVARDIAAMDPPGSQR